MELEKIISISGKPGLYKLVSQVKSGFIVEDITTKKKVSIGNSSQVSLLDNIAMYTMETEVPLFDIFENIAKENGYQETITHKSTDAELRDLMEQALPNYDKARVYVSDMKKLAQWYNTLHKAGYITESSFVKPESEESENTEGAPEKQKAKKSSTVKTEKTVIPKTKESTSTAKTAVKSTHTKKG